MLIIGITGTLGAGKGTIVDFLVSQKGFAHYSVRAFIAGEIRRRGKTVNRDTLTEVANELRRANSPSYITDELFYQAQKTGKDAVIESIRTPGEIYSLREKGRFILFAVDAYPEIRYRRIKARKSETDDISFETFIMNEKREMESLDPFVQNISKCIELADYRFLNNGSIDELNLQVSKTLQEVILSFEF